MPNNNEGRSFSVPLEIVKSGLFQKLPEEVVTQYVETGVVEGGTTPLIRQVLTELIPKEVAGVVISDWSYSEKNGNVVVSFQPASKSM